MRRSRPLHAGKGKKWKGLLLGAGAVVAAGIVIYLLYSATKADTLVKRGQKFADAWNEIQGFADEEGKENLLSFCLPDSSRSRSPSEVKPLAAPILLRRMHEDYRSCYSTATTCTLVNRRPVKACR